MLEIIATSVEDAVVAEQAGAGRIELVSSLREGGLTPSHGLIERTLRAVSIPVRVMIRPHSRDFVYTEDELETMLADIRAARELGASGLVMGALTADSRVCVPTMRQLCKAAGGLPVTFHRAADETSGLRETLQLLETIPAIDRVLTSGGNADGAWEGRMALRELQARTTLRLIAGKGLLPEHLQPFLAETALTEVHMGTGVRYGRTVNGGIDAGRVRQAAECVRRAAADHRGKGGTSGA